MHIDSTGKYYLSAINRCGTGSDTINIDSLFKRTLDLGNDTVICLGDSMILDISDTSATYLWNDGFKKAKRVIDSTGIYWGESSNLCGTIRDTISIEVLAPPTIDLGKDRRLCKSRGEYVIFGELAASKHSYYTWSNGLKGPNTYRLLSYNSGVFWVEEKNKCGAAYDTITITADLNIPRLFGLDSVVCLGDTVLLKPLVKVDNYKWSNGKTDSVIKVFQAGSYWLEASNGCGKKRDTIEYILREIPNIGLPSDTIICNGDSATLEVKSPNTNFLWSTGSKVSLIRASKTGLYWVNASNICGSDRDSVKIDVDQIPIVSLPSDTILCNNDHFFIEANAIFARTYLWNTGNLTSKQNIRKGGRYSVTAINKCGTDTAQIWIDHELTPDPKLISDTLICQGDRIELRTHVPPEILAYSHVKWNNKFDSKELYVERAGWYKVDVSNRCGVGSDEIEVKVRSLPRIRTAKDTIVCDNVIEYDNTNTNYTFLWQDGSTAKRYKINSPGEYSVEMWDELGCYSSARFVVRQCPSEMWAPNAFSPNYDELNESFRVYKDGIKDFEIEIYDRWNKLVFSSTDITEGWEGTVENDDNRPCVQGMYIWKVKFKEIENNQQQIIMGEVNLVR
jgi:gliding motility-associated-like protein